ncbi:MAG: hypothetical protein H7Z37_14430 [Pyrinomonadaceae bacterium]|nr:hypothetical protein [Pyrinomonadaceae bacterium]
MYKKIDISQCRKADVIVTTGSSVVSGGIRNGIGSSVSHAMLYVGDLSVIEAIAKGVTKRSWTQAITVDGEVTLAIALRRKNMDDNARNGVVEAAMQFEGRPYDTLGAIGSARFGDRRGGIIYGVGCAVVGPIVCNVSDAEILKNAEDANADKAMFCSELVTRAFTEAGYKIVEGKATWQTPGAVRNSSFLEYVGHIIDTPPKVNNLTDEEIERNSRRGYRKG